MTQQFKFGDRVRNEEGNEFVYLRGYLSSCTLATEDGSLYRCSGKHVTLIPHPDTVRLDWLADRDNHIGNVQLPAECVEQHLDSMRDAIDAAMRIQAAEAVWKAKPAKPSAKTPSAAAKK